MSDLQDFREKTFEQLDREVEEAVREDRRRKIRSWLILLVIWIFLCPDAFLFWFRFGLPHFPKYRTEEIIDITKEPVQIDITENRGKYFKYKTLENRGSYSLEKMAKYSISGKLVAKNYFFWGNYIPNGDRPFQSVSLIDIGMVWKEMSNKDIMDCMRYVSAKDLTQRALHPRFVRNKKCYVLANEYAEQVGGFSELYSKYSHTHVIPANASVMHALMIAPKNRPIKMEGYLVDVYKDGRAVALTSLSRHDVGAYVRGKENGPSGACEVMYVERVQIGNKVWE